MSRTIGIVLDEGIVRPPSNDGMAIRRVSGRMIVIQVLVQGITASVFSLNARQCSLNDSLKRHF